MESVYLIEVKEHHHESNHTHTYVGEVCKEKETALALASDLIDAYLSCTKAMLNDTHAEVLESYTLTDDELLSGSFMRFMKADTSDDIVYVSISIGLYIVL